MLRRLVAAFLVLAIAVPLPALAGGGCQMDEPMLSAERCECCTSPMVAGSSACATVAGTQVGCGCALRADSGSQPASSAVIPSPNPAAASTRSVNGSNSRAWITRRSYSLAVRERT